MVRGGNFATMADEPLSPMTLRMQRLVGWLGVGVGTWPTDAAVQQCTPSMAEVLDLANTLHIRVSTSQ